MAVYPEYLATRGLTLNDVLAIATRGYIVNLSDVVNLALAAYGSGIITLPVLSKDLVTSLLGAGRMAQGPLVDPSASGYGESTLTAPSGLIRASSALYGQGTYSVTIEVTKLLNFQGFSESQFSAGLVKQLDLQLLGTGNVALQNPQMFEATLSGESFLDAAIRKELQASLAGEGLLQTDTISTLIAQLSGAGYFVPVALDKPLGIEIVGEGVLDSRLELVKYLSGQLAGEGFLVVPDEKALTLTVYGVGDISARLRVWDNVISTIQFVLSIGKTQEFKLER